MARPKQQLYARLDSDTLRDPTTKAAFAAFQCCISIALRYSAANRLWSCSGGSAITSSWTCMPNRVLWSVRERLTR
jgi:hypothetical protein